MCFFNKNNQNPYTANVTTNTTSQSNSNEQTFVFEAIPKTLQELKDRPEISLDSPYKTAALALCALCIYGKDRENGKEMLNFLRGLQPPLSPAQLSFLNDRFMDGKQYVPYSYFDGAVPANDYTPSQPYTVKIFADPHSFDNDGYAKLNMRSGGADSPRSIQLRRANGQWFLWEQYILVGIRDPKSQNPWG